MFSFTKKPLDFLAVGDIVTDAFIRLKDASVNCSINHESCQLCVRFGDKVPYESVTIVPAVGNSPNAGVSAHRLGLRSAILTDVGDDRYGEEIRETLRQEGIPLTYVRVHKNEASNYHYVLQYEAERTILVKHQHYAYTFPDITPAPRWIYLSSLAENSLAYHLEIADYLDKHPETQLSFQPGTFQMKLGTKQLARLYARTTLFFCNKEEAERILNVTGKSIKELLALLREQGPKVAIITDGPKGAYVSDGTETLFIPMYPDPKPPVSRTGAGDAFASTFTGAIALGKTLKEALSWGPINSMSVVQHIGAQKGLLSRSELEKLLREAPDSYVPRAI